MLYSSLDAILVYESYFTELASLAKYFLITLVVGCSYFNDILIKEYSDLSLLHGARFARKILFQLHLSLDVFLNHTCRWMFHSLSNALFIFGCYSRLRISLLHGARFARKIFFHYTCRWVFLLFPHAFFIYRCYSHLRIFLLHGARFARKIFFNHTCRWLVLLLPDALLVLRCFLIYEFSTSSFVHNIFFSITLVVGCFSYFRMIDLFLHAILVFESPYFTELASLATFLSSPLVIGCLYFDDILINKYLDELINNNQYILASYDRIGIEPRLIVVVVAFVPHRRRCFGVLQ